MSYLEENLVELQNLNRNLILERQVAEEGLHVELDNLKLLVNAMTVPLWQFGECGITGQTLASRICLPVWGGIGGGNDEENNKGESLEEESYMSSDDDDDEEEEDASNNEIMETNEVLSLVQNLVCDASTQTIVNLSEKGTITDVIVFPQHPSPIISYCGSTAKIDEFNAPKANLDQCSPYLSSDCGSQDQVRNVIISLGHLSMGSKFLFVGGMPAGGQQRIFVHKYCSMIRPAVLKGTK